MITVITRVNPYMLIPHQASVKPYSVRPSHGNDHCGHAVVRLRFPLFVVYPIPRRRGPDEVHRVQDRAVRRVHHYVRRASFRGQSAVGE